MLFPRVIANLMGSRDRDGVFGVTCCRSRVFQRLEISGHTPLRASKLAKLGRSTKLPLTSAFRTRKRKYGIKEFARDLGARFKALARRHREPELAPPIAEITQPPTEVVADSRNLSAPASSQLFAYELPPTVLIADANRVSRAIFRKQLTQSGFRVQEATSGEDAVDKINFDTAAVLLDVHSPGGDGLHALREIRRRFAPVKVVITSADQDLETTVIAMKLGAFDSLAKNANREELVHVLTRAMQTQPVTQNIRVA
jgi:CheY-like chemotaxis protein